MARIPDAVVARLKREVSLLRLVEAAGVALVEQRRGEWAGVCPFHPGDEAEAGLVVLKAANSWRCSAGCGGSVVDWVMRAEGVSFRHAVELLRDGHTPTRLDRPPPERSSVTRLDAPFSADLSDGELVDSVLAFSCETLKANVDAQAWLADRRCATAERNYIKASGVGKQGACHLFRHTMATLMLVSKEELLAALEQEVDLENRPHPGEPSGDRP